MKHHKWLLWVAVSIILGMAGYAAWHHWMSPTRILVVNALEAQQADFVLNNDSRHIKVTCMEADEMHDIDDFDAIIVYARRIFLSDGQMAEIEQAARKGIPIFTKTLRSSTAMGCATCATLPPPTAGATNRWTPPWKCRPTCTTTASTDAISRRLTS